MKICVVTVPSSKEEWLSAAEVQYTKKIKGFCTFDLIHLKSKAKQRQDWQAKREEDSLAILDFFDPNDRIVLLDETGKTQDSITWAKAWQKKIDQLAGNTRWVFVIGGPYGVTDEIKTKAHEKIALSNFTLNHWVAEVVLLEQIYRALTILKGVPYHNA